MTLPENPNYSPENICGPIGGGLGEGHGLKFSACCRRIFHPHHRIWFTEWKCKPRLPYCWALFDNRVKAG